MGGKVCVNAVNGVTWCKLKRASRLVKLLSVHCSVLVKVQPKTAFTFFGTVEDGSFFRRVLEVSNGIMDHLGFHFVFDAKLRIE